MVPQELTWIDKYLSREDKALSSLAFIHLLIDWFSPISLQKGEQIDA